MKKVFVFSILVLAFCVCSFAQTNNSASCPDFSLKSEPLNPNPNDYIFYTVVFDNDFDKEGIKYEWIKEVIIHPMRIGDSILKFEGVTNIVPINIR